MKSLIILFLLFGGNFIVFAQKNFDKSSAPETAVYIPADKRHRGLSRYDLIPFTDRVKGDPDRYRAVNPKYVRRENGRYFYALTVKSGTHFYDRNLKDQGVLNDANVEVDLTETKSFKAADGKNFKYVFVKNKGFVLATAIEQSAEEIKSGRWFYFPLKSGEQAIYDGTGIERGKLAVKSLKLNYGLQKEIRGETFYYAFSTKMKLKGENIGVSGWIKASAIETGNDPQFDQNFVKKMQMPTAADDQFARYEITGGEPQEIVGKDADGKPIYKFGYADKAGNFAAYKVLPKISPEKNVAVTDYLKRSDDVINLGFNPAGVSSDTFRIEGQNRPLIFYRSREQDATIEIDLFYAKDDAHDGEKSVGRIRFVYGYVAVPDGKRWGWIPLDALRLAAKK